LIAQTLWAGVHGVASLQITMCDDTWFNWEPVLYTTYFRALSWAPRERQLLSYVLVKVRDKNKIAEIAKRIHERTGLVALTASEFQSLTMWFVLNQTGILVNFGITIFLGVIIGILVSGQLFYTFILDNSRHFAALKAMGVTKLSGIVDKIFVQLGQKIKHHEPL
jgi:putative ABC transport system permease protein